MNREFLINDLNRIMREKSWITPEDLSGLAQKYSMPLSAVSETAAFYDHLRLKPSGKHTIKICVGTACFVKGSDKIYEAFFKELKLKPGEDTDSENLFTLQKAACLGCCMLAPAVQIGKKIFGPVNEKDAAKILADYLNSSAAAESDAVTMDGDVRIKVCTCSSCSAAGASEILQNAKDVITAFDLNASVHESSCHGRSYQAPVLAVEEKGHVHEFGPVRPEEVHQLIGHYASGRHFFKNIVSKTAVFFSKLSSDATSERRIIRGEEGSRFVMDKAGISLPLEDVSSAVWDERRDFFKALLAKSPVQILDTLERSGLRGRGGAGFPSARKWETVLNAEGKTKFIIVNADEGDPGAFMDRLVLESFPYRVLEGVLIGAYVTGAQKAIIYVRSEYPLAVARIRAAVSDFLESGLLGENILGFSLNLTIDIVEGAGAFVCGEESALIASIEGGPGRPKIRPPYPAVKGLFGYPTLVNNVETFACVSAIFRRSDEVFSLTGTETSKGTKTFALAGKIRNGGLIEVPMGITLREIIFGIGGGMEEGRTFKAVQLGGPSGGCLGIDSLDQKVDFDSLKKVGAMMGSGGLVVLDDHDCMVQIALYFTRFAAQQSCGQCVFCREGSRQIAALLEGIAGGHGKKNDLDEILRIGNQMKYASLCSLGKTAALPALSTIMHFREEYEEHLDGFCRSGRCREIAKFVISEDCIGCTRCAQICPVQAIDKRPYYQHEIFQDKCTVCGSCFDRCPRKAIRVQKKTVVSGRLV